jgi:DNA-binding SARP family transcriptional activator/tetratricopeptide (TPR) repeat protein
VEFGVLGPVQVRMAGEVIGTGHPRQRAVLAVLLLDLGRVVPVQVLIDRVWGEGPPASVRNVLYGYVGRLRAVLARAADPDVTLVRDHGGYVLRARPGQVDLWRFRRLVTEAEHGSGDDGHRVALLRQALELWRGPALTGTQSPWLDAMGRTLEAERFAAELDLNEIRLRRGEHRVLAPELAGQVAVRPADEQLTGQLMLALWRSGRPAEALRCFERARSYLEQELGADPGPQLQALHQQILRGADDLALPGQDRRPAVCVPRELPADVPAFTGRVAELGQLDQLLRSAGDGQGVSAAVISAVSGTAGVGKTALALHWAHRAVPVFPDGQLYADLRGYDAAPPLTPAEVLAAFLRVPGADTPRGRDARAARYRSLLAGKRMLIVLDNASSAEQVRPLLPGAPACVTIVTSRDSLAGLIARAGGARLEVDLLPLADAVSLLRDLIGPRAAADPDSVTELAGLCARLPLALRVAAELAAARQQAALASLVAELADQRRRLDLLDAAGDPRTAVRAVFSWSYRNLAPAAARTFRLLGLHPGITFDGYAAAALTGTGREQAGPLLDTLSRAHLLQAAGPSRYAMHDLLRAYARELAAGAGETDEALDRLLDYYLYAAATAMDVILPGERSYRPRAAAPSASVPSLTGPDAARQWLDSERAAMIALIRYTAEHGWRGQAAQLAVTLFRYLDYGGHWSEGAIIHELASRAARQAGDRAAEAEALNNLGVTELRQGHYQQASTRHSRALALSRQAGDRRGAARALNNLGLICYQQGAYDKAAGQYRQALAACRELGDQGGAAGVLGNLAVIGQRQGRHEQAAGHAQQALELFRQVGNRDGEATVLGMLADSAQRLGDDRTAAGYLQQALELFRQTGNRDGEASALDSLAALNQQQGQYEQAAGHLRQALKLFRDTGNRNGEAAALNGLGRAFLAAGQPEDARAQHAAALGTASQIGDAHEQARAHHGLGDAYRASGDEPQARNHWQQSLKLYDALGVPEASQIRVQLAGDPGRHHATSQSGEHRQD